MKNTTATYAPSPTPAKSSARRSQTERRADAERRLLESAVEVLATKGVHGMTLSEVGAAAGYSRGLVAHHYGSKEAFLRAVAEYTRNRYREGHQQGAEPGLPALLANVDLYLNASSKTFAAVNAMIAEATLAGGTLKQDMQNFNAMTQKFFAGMIREGIKRRQIRPDVDPDTQAMLIVGMLRGVSTQYLLNEGVARSRVRREAAETIRRALAA